MACYEGKVVMVKFCAYCGAVKPEPPEAIHLTPSERTVYEYVARHPACPTDDIMAKLYGHRHDGGPMEPRGTVHVYINRINKKLPDHKIQSSARGPGATYRLVLRNPNVNL